MTIDIYTVGGYDEVGRNMTAIKYNDQAVIFDMGISLDNLLISGRKSFETLNYSDLAREEIIPNDNILSGFKDQVKAIVISHGHLDHIASAPKLSHRYHCPIISRAFTIEFLKKLIKEEKIHDTKNPLVKLSINQKYRISKDLEVELVHVTHSIPQTAIVVLHTPEGRVVYANDYKLDNYPMLESPPDYKRLREIGREGVKALIVESLYIHLKEKTPPEKSVKDMLLNLIPNLDPDKAIVATCFSSHIERIKSLVEMAKQTNRRLVFMGRSLSEYLAVAQKLNLIEIPKGCIYRPPRVKKILRDVERNRDKYFMIMTGSQGEPDAILSRITRGQYKFDFRPGDQVIFSCSVVPSPINRSNREILERRLEAKGVRIFRDVHVSGHAHREDHRTLIKLLNPEHVIPTHAETHKLGMFADFLLDLNKEYGKRKYQLGKTIHILENQQKVAV